MTAGDCPPPEQARLLLHIRRVGTGLLLIAGVAAATFARDVLLPVVFAFFNATTLRPQARGGVPTSLISI